MLYASDGEAQKSKSLKEVFVQLEQKEATLVEVFKQIESQTNFQFNYDKKSINKKTKVVFDSNQTSIEQLLTDIGSSEKLHFRRINNNISVSPASDSFDQRSVVRELADINISGKVTDENNEGLPGASVVLKGTTTGTTTDLDGNYSLIVDENATLVISYVGYEQLEVGVGARSVVDVQMTLDAAQLEEIVIIGFGERKKKDLTSSISTVNADAIEKAGATSPQFSLQGNTTGVRVINTSGDPNAPPQIFVRGVGSWQGNAQPLYVIDGQIITPPTAGNLDLISRNGNTPPPNLWTMISPDDIESISVLKDASSAAIYGSRGANGVILITTKKGKKGAPSVEFNAERGWQNIDTYDMQNTEQYVSLVEEMYANNRNPDVTIENQLFGRNAADDVTRRVSFSPQFDPTSPFYISSRDTYNWQNELVRKNAITESYDVKVSGASDNTDYYLSIGFDNRESTIKGNGLKTYRASMNVNSKVNDYLKVGLNYKFAYQEAPTQDPGLSSAAVAPPWQPIYNSNNQYGYQEVLDTESGNWNRAKIYGQGTRDNYLASMSLNRSLFQNMRHMAQGYVELSPLEGLKIRGGISLDLTEQDRIGIRTYRSNIFRTGSDDPAIDSPNDPNSLGFYESRKNSIFNYQADLSVTYDKSFGKHRFTFTGAIQDQYNTAQNENISGESLSNIKNLNRIGFGNDQANNSSFSGWGERFWYGYVGRLNYSMGEKNYLDLSLRRDASSGMAKDFRWGTFWSVSGAWRVSSESFMQNVSFINDLKLRAGYGEAGNDEVAVGRFAYLSRAGGSGSYGWGSGNGNILGNYNTASSLNDFPNEALVWEVARTTYVGFDALMLNSKMNLTVELYDRTQDGIQQIVNLPLSVGVNDPLLNIGKLQNRGIDLQLGYNDRVGEFTYGVSSNISFLKNEIVELYNDQPLTSTNQFQVTYRVEEGRSIGHIWGYKVGGIFQTQAEIDAYYAETSDSNVQDPSHIAPGDMYFQDVHGDPTEEEPFYSTTPDGKVNSYDQTEIGNTIPGYTYGLNLNAGYKGFDLTLSFYGEGNVDKYNWNRRALENMSSAGPNYGISVQNRWTESNKNTDMPRAVIGDPAGNNRYSDRYVESAAFFRLNSWQLGYNLPDAILEKVNYAIRSVRFYIGGQNNIYLNSWKGLDPVNDTFPLPKTFLIGLKAKF